MYYSGRSAEWMDGDAGSRTSRALGLKLGLSLAKKISSKLDIFEVEVFKRSSNKTCQYHSVQAKKGNQIFDPF